MAIHYTLRVEGDILFVKTSGFDERLADVQAYALGIIDACRKGSVSRVLCDETVLEYRLGTFDTYRAGEFLSKNVPLLAQIAIVCNPEFFCDASFFEDVVVNRGMRLRFFTDMETAKRWLQEGSSSLNS
jgi:hypothetical protein